MLLTPRKMFICLWLVVTCSLHSNAQDFSNPGEYLDYINKKSKELSVKYLSYLSASSHGKSARKVDKRRTEVINLISDTRFDIQGIPPFKGDRSFRDSTVSYLKLLYIVFN